MRLKEKFAQNKVLLLQRGHRFFVYSSNMTAITSCEHTLFFSNIEKKGEGEVTFHEWREEKGKRLVIFMCQQLLSTVIGSKTVIQSTEDVQ